MFKKLLLLTIIVACLLPLCVQAQTTGPDEFMLTGVMFDNESGFGSYAGIAARITGGLWSLSRISATQGGAALEPDFAYLWNLNSWIVGPIAAPNAQFVGGGDPITYLAGAGGVIVGKKYKGHIKQGVPIDIGIYAHCKYVFPLDAGADFPKRWQTGISVAAGF